MIEKHDSCHYQEPYAFNMALQNFSVKTGRRVSGHLEDGLGEPLLIDAKPGQDDDGQDNDDNDDDPEESHRPATSLAAAYRLLTPSVKVPFSTIFFRCFACNALYYHRCTVQLLLLSVSSALAYVYSLKLIRFNY